MRWEDDLLLRDDVPQERLLEVVASALGVAKADTILVDDVTRMSGPSPALIIERTRLGGEFPTLLKIYLKPEATKPPLTVAREIAAQLPSDVLMSDDSTDPYLMMLVERSGATSTVSLDMDRLDSHGEYVLQRG